MSSDEGSLPLRPVGCKRNLHDRTFSQTIFRFFDFCQICVLTLLLCAVTASLLHFTAGISTFGEFLYYAHDNFDKAWSWQECQQGGRQTGKLQNFHIFWNLFVESKVVLEENGCLECGFIEEDSRHLNRY